MKTKDYVYIGAYLILFTWFVNNIVKEKQYQNEQFEKINKLNNDLITISNYLDNNIKDVSNNNNQIDYISIQLEELRKDLTDTQNSAESFYQMFFDTQPQRIAREEEEKELVEETENRTQDLQSTPAPSETKEQEVVELPVEVPVVKITPTASCPTPHMKLLPYINDISLRRDYSFRVSYDVLDNKIVNVNYQPSIPNKLKRGIQNYLNSFTLKGDIKDCYIPIKILGN
tara:strand:+ start:2473 stop:3159 length:687 start_codon:yes stop_codon:yes gene_type:complete